MKMRDLMTIAEKFTLDREQLDAPDLLGGLIDISWLADMLHVAPEDRTTFHNAMMKIIANRSENMNDFEVFNIADAFIDFMGLSLEEKMQVSRRLSMLHTDKNDHHLDPEPEEGEEGEPDLEF